MKKRLSVHGFSADASAAGPAASAWAALMISLVVSLASVSACSGTREGSAAGGLTLDILRNCTYKVGAGEVRLQEGSLTAGRSVRDYMCVNLADAALGELDGDGRTDGVVILRSSNGSPGVMAAEENAADGGAGTAMNAGGAVGAVSYELTAMLTRDAVLAGSEAGNLDRLEMGRIVSSGKVLARQTNSIELGDGVKIQTLLILHGEVLLDMQVYGPADKPCCPTVKVRKTYIVKDGVLVETVPLPD